MIGPKMQYFWIEIGDVQKSPEPCKESRFLWGDPGVYPGGVLTILRSFLIVFGGSLLFSKRFPALFLCFFGNYSWGNFCIN